MAHLANYEVMGPQVRVDSSCRPARPFALSGSLQLGFYSFHGRGREISYHYQHGSSFELTISCETCAIALLGKKSHS
jgi:hypothetical protein